MYEGQYRKVLPLVWWLAISALASVARCRSKQASWMEVVPTAMLAWALLE